jgi:beta-N-acetylhexosaminidase
LQQAPFSAFPLEKPTAYTIFKSETRQIFQKLLCNFLEKKNLLGQTFCLGSSFSNMLKDLKVSKLPMVRWPSAFCLLLWPILCWGSPALAATLESQAGQMIMCGFRGLQIEPEAPILKDLQAGRCGGVILFDRDLQLKSDVRNIADTDQVAALVRQLQARAEKPLLIAVDQEGGKVARLKPRHGFAAWPSAQALGKTNDLETTRQVGSSIGKALSSLGVNLNLAPVVDVNANPANPVIGRLGRSFSDQPEQVAAHAGAFIQGLHEWGVLSCIKHFPGHGSSSTDSHLGLTEITESWSRTELLPYQALIQAGLCDMIMTGHLVHQGLDPVFPATLSRAILRDLLREELEFKGVIVSDDLQMKAIRNEFSLSRAILHSVRAGVDILLFGNNLEYDPHIARTAHSILVRLVKEGVIARARIQASWTRIQTLKNRLARP